MDNTVIVTTPAQLQSIISDAVNAILPKLADFRRKNEPVESDGMNIEDAARFLTEQSVPLLGQRSTITYTKIRSRTRRSDAA